MRRLLVSLLALLLLPACPTESRFDPPPTDRFTFPTGIVHVPRAGGGQGWLLVASSAFDREFESGSILAVDLDQVGALPAFGAPPPVEPPNIDVLPVNAFLSG
jgi:hypothetical protein